MGARTVGPLGKRFGCLAPAVGAADSLAPVPRPGSDPALPSESWLRASASPSSEHGGGHLSPGLWGRSVGTELPAQRPGPSCLSLHRGECSSGELHARGPQVPGSLEPLAPSQGDVLARGPAPSGDQEPLDQPPSPERQPQPPAGAQGCPQCLVLQREVDDLKEQLAAMRALTEKFQPL